MKRGNTHLHQLLNSTESLMTETLTKTVTWTKVKN